MKKLLNLRSSLSSINTSWKDKTPMKSTETVRMVANLSKTFLQTQSFFIVWNQKQMIFVLGRPWSRENKLLIFKRSSKTFTQKTKSISNYIHQYIGSKYIQSISSVTPCDSSSLNPLRYQLIGTKGNPWLAVYLQSPINSSNDTSTLPLTFQSCYKSLGILNRVIKNK